MAADIRAAAEWAVAVRVGDEVNEEVTGTVRRIAKRLEEAAFPGLIEAVPALVSVMAIFDPAVVAGASKVQPGTGKKSNPAEDDTSAARAAAWLRSILADMGPDSVKRSERTVDIPVCYGGESGPDLEHLAEKLGMSPQDIVSLHSGAVYRVAMLGFLPGFPYLTGLPKQLHAPRREVPRVSVDAGAVGIGGGQTGVYPVRSPGGWQLIGRTPVRLLRPEHNPPVLLEAGDRVRFVPISAERYAELEQVERVKAGDGGIVPGTGRAETTGGAIVGSSAVEVVNGGLWTTVQDGGRRGYRRFGVPWSGALDLPALRTANALVGNEPDTAGLECTLSGPELRFRQETVFAVCGGEFELRLDGDPVPSGRPALARAGSVLRVGRAVHGCRAYVALAGGVLTPPALGSRSTDVRSGLGGLQGSALQPGAALPLGAPTPTGAALLRQLRESGPARWGAAGFAAAAVGAGGGRAAQPPRRAAAVLRFVRGPEWAALGPAAAAALAAGAWAVQPESDRMGIRLHGEVPLADGTAAAAGTMLSEPVLPGTIQLPPSGQPVLLLSDGQTTGGYPRIAQVAFADLGVAAQLRPGDIVRLREITLAEAETLWLKQVRELAVLQTAVRIKSCGV
ncbi:5-oxoprolinase subunit PxpB [Paenibacillus chartarius]|uniref:5-oxoprolinase subunit PxpB n=1 Tax=Paenibacillus chartarius TaxID=747481 RepID=A0ABV6DMS1_9BACL